jgi:hypothetical protein
MARRLNEEQAAVNAGILDIAVTLSGKLLPEVRRVLILDVLHNWVPAGGALACRPQQLRSCWSYHLSLLTWSPYPGVSTMLSRRRTPFSSMTGHG